MSRVFVITMSASGLSLSFIRLNSFQRSVGSMLKVSVSTQTLAQGVLLRLWKLRWERRDVHCFHDHHVRIGTDAVVHLVDFVS